jgi:hypothetical protein
MIKNLQLFLEFVPVAVITLIFVTEKELRHRAYTVSFQTIKNVIAMFLFFSISLAFPKFRTQAFIFSILFWILATIFQKKYLSIVVLELSKFRKNP